MRNARWVAVALLALPSAARAGPIVWDYRTEVTYDRDYGSRFAVTLAPAGTVSTTPGEVGGAELFTSTGNPRPEPGSYGVSYGFTISVTITDRASGESGTLDFAGGYSTQWSYTDAERDDPDRWRWDGEGSSFGDIFNRRVLNLGETVYSVWVEGGGQGQFPNGVMLVEVASTANTPEPGTLVLAGLGLAGAGLVRRRVSPK